MGVSLKVMAQASDFWNQQVGEQAIKEAFYLPSMESTTEVVTDSPEDLPEISKGSAWPVLLILLALFG